MTEKMDREGLVDRLMRQRELLTRLEELGERQDELVSTDRTEELIALLAERQRIVDDVVELGRDLDAALGGIAEHEDPTVQSLREQVTGAARRIAERDERHRSELDRRRRALSSEMADVGRGRSAMAAYSRRPKGPAARFQDTEA